MTHSVIISLASNSLADEHLALARAQLEALLSHFSTTRQIRTAAYGKPNAAPYLNQLAVGATPLDVTTLNARLKAIEQSMGRTPESKALGVVPIDLDLMAYDGERFHEADWQRPYVSALLNDEGQPDLTTASR